MTRVEAGARRVNLLLAREAVERVNADWHEEVPLGITGARAYRQALDQRITELDRRIARMERLKAEMEAV